MMRIRCNREILSALKDIEFPKTKNQILALAETKNDICEASVIMLNKLENRTYHSIDEVCENVKVICNLELRNGHFY
ncbi:MAG: DUF2795 domain-containing protein, partial [Actinobacteria bacterium]|nr:DUF2795 domain-containing protein [Actinomycetota bacterium]